ncbi:MAG: hypothetical protein JXC31_05845 [Acholeplasmataceae bacterium]|nr:hypothetical protein [Acholeplasmataceae bacterium]
MAVNYMKNFDMKKVRHYHEFGATYPIPDEYVGELSVNDKKLVFQVEPRDQIDYSENNYSFRSKKYYQVKNIFVILESPHRFEFDASGNPIALMMGKTGQLFFENFAYYLSQSQMKLINGTYNVICGNAVQYQTSCGLNPINRIIRDQNWREIYLEHGGELDLKQRIFSIKPKYTINLCTGGKNPEGLRCIVSHSLDTFGLKKGKHYTEGNHPSSWYMKNNNSNLII